MCVFLSCPSAPRWPLEALPGEAPPLAAHEACAGVRQPEKWRKSGGFVVPTHVANLIGNVTKGHSVFALERDIKKEKQTLHRKF